MSNVIEQARDLKSDAMEARDEGDFELAARLIGRAENRLRGALEELKSSRDDGTEPGKFEVDIANQLVYILGSKGGIHRRWARDLKLGGDARRSDEVADESIRAYDAGYDIEKPGAGYGIVNSYNLVQRLVARVLKESDCVVEGRPAVNGVTVRGGLLKALEEIQRQRDSKRAGDEYAAADEALVCILLGKEEWASVLYDFVNFSPPPEQYAIDVTFDLIGELRETLAGSPRTPPDLVERLSAAYKKLAPYASGQ